MSVPTVVGAAVSSRVTGSAKRKAAAYPYNGGSRRNIATPGEQPAPSDPPTDGAGPAEPSENPARETPAPPERPAAASGGGGRPWRLPSASGTVRDGSGIALGFLLWVWVVLPYLDGGVGRVRQVLAAKLTNTGPDGSALP